MIFTFVTLTHVLTQTIFSNFHPLGVVGRSSGTQLQVGENAWVTTCDTKAVDMYAFTRNF